MPLHSGRAPAHAQPLSLHSQVALPSLLPLQLAYLVWKSVYITKQVSFRNRVLILFDVSGGRANQGGTRGRRMHGACTIAPCCLLAAAELSSLLISVALQWLKAQVFGRDLSNF